MLNAKRLGGKNKQKSPAPSPLQVEDWGVCKKCCAVPIPNFRKAPLPATVGFAQPLCFPGQIWILLTLGRAYVHNRARETMLWEKWQSLWWISVQPTPSLPMGTQWWRDFSFFLHLHFRGGKKDSFSFRFISYMDEFLFSPPTDSLFLLMESIHYPGKAEEHTHYMKYFNSQWVE